MTSERRDRAPAAAGPASLDSEPPSAPSPRSLRGLDWFIFFVADVQTGFGPFVAVYLTTQKWTQVDIGLVLSAAGFVSLIAQMPGGALVDAARSERLVAGIAVAVICLSALAYAVYPIFPVVLSAAVVTCGRKLRARPGHCRDQPRPCRARGHQRPAWAATPALPPSATRWRQPRWARAATLSSARAVFIVTVLSPRPGFAGAAHDIARARSIRSAPTATRRDAAPKPPTRAGRADAKPAVAHLRRLYSSVSSCQCRHAAVDGQRRSPCDRARWATAPDRRLHRRAAASWSPPSRPGSERRAQIWGRRPLLLIGFAALPIRGLLFATVTNPDLAGRRAGPRRRHGGGVRRHGAARSSPISRAEPDTSISGRGSSAHRPG